MHSKPDTSREDILDPIEAPPEGRVAVVTGGAKRIGAAIVTALHGAGYRVVIHYNSAASTAAALADTLNQQRADSVFALSADLTEAEAPARVIAASLDRFGRIDLLVNNASVYEPTPLDVLHPDDFDRIIHTNLRAPLLAAAAAAPHLRTAAGSVVNITDIYAERPTEQHSVYIAAKAGLAAVTRSLALDLAPAVRVNAIAPGAMLWPAEGASDERRQRILERIPLRRAGCAEDIAGAVLFLAESPYITGHTLTVDGGRSLTI